MEQQGAVGGRGVERRSSSRRQHRRTNHGCGLDERRPTKRLFTPEIKRFLKGWLVRRRDNPYPNRDEKKSLAVQTGLTYVQVCNWFANWRRKLKNAGGEPQRSTWGHLIKAYNTQAHGNVEHFSICSDDSIWEEQQGIAATVDHCYTATAMDVDALNGGGKYKNHIMEKYLRDLGTESVPAEDEDDTEVNSMDDKPKLLSKWLQSAANFRPRRENYVGWERRKSRTANGKRKKDPRAVRHDREELDAAEALTKLACTSASAS